MANRGVAQEPSQKMQLAEERRRPKFSPIAHRSPILVCLGSSAGGHLTELEALSAGTDSFSQMLVTVTSPHSDSTLLSVPRRHVKRIERNPANLLVNAMQALQILLRERPSIVISTGAGDLVPLMLLASMLGIPMVFVESIARVSKPSLTGRIVRRWANLILIPWPTLRRAYPAGVCFAAFPEVAEPTDALPSDPSILVLTGASGLGFDRLVREVDRLASNGGLHGKILAQIGASTHVPRSFPSVRYMTHQELLKAVDSCDIVITHDGAGTISEALRAGKRILVVPRRFEERELAYKSESELASHLAALGWITLVENPENLGDALRDLRLRPPAARAGNGRPARDILREFLSAQF